MNIQKLKKLYLNEKAAEAKKILEDIFRISETKEYGENDIRHLLFIYCTALQDLYVKSHEIQKERVVVDFRIDLQDKKF